MDYGNETSDSLTEGYVTAEEDSTRYLSVLETSHEMTLESLNLTLGNTGTQLPDQNNGDTVALTTESGELNTIDINGQQVVVYNIDGGEELFGLQFVQDEQGKLQKYQFQLRTNDEGQMEAIPETIQLLPIEDESTITQEADREVLNEHSEHNYTEETTDDHLSNTSTETISHAPEELPQNEDLQNVDVLEGHLCEESHHTVDDVKTGEIEVHYIKEEVLNDEQTMSEEAHKSNKLVQFNDNSVYTIRTDDHSEESNKVVDFERSYHNGQPIDTETDTQESVAQYEEVFVQETHNLEDNGDEDQQVVAYIGQNIEEIPHDERELYYSQNSEDTVYDNIENDSDNDDYHIVEGLHITGDVEEEINPDISNNITTMPESVLKNTCLMNIKDTEKKDLKTVLYYVVRHPEKENVNSLSLSNPVLYKPAKVNPRSLLKSSHMEHKTQQENIQTEKLNKRFSRSKEAMEERLFMNFINRTTIPVEPVRNHRLPRKQKIKPIKRMDDEEIVVQEVVVSSNGFIETLEDGVLKSKEPLKVTETVTLTDSDDDYDPKQAKKKKHRYKKQKQRAEIVISDSTDTEESVIEILSDNDEQQLESDKSTSTPKKGRGRPKKTPDEKVSNESDITDNSKSPIKRGRGRPPKLSKINEDEDSESPAKKSRTDDSEDSPSSKNEIKCPKCTKFLASPNSLKTHLQHHNLENSIKNSEASNEVTSSIEANKVTSSTEVNEVTSSTNLPNEVKSKTDIVKCTNEDKPTVVKAPIKESTKISTTRYSVQPRVVTRAKSICNTKVDICYKHKCLDCNVTFKNGILLKRHICTKKPMMNKLECSICKKYFPDIAMLNIHKKSHVKNNLVKNTTTAKVSPKVVRTSSMVSTFKSPKKYGIHKCNECGKVCSSVTILNAHMKSHKKFSCNTCKAVFPSRILLDTHIRESCVKTVPPHSRRLSFKVKKSFIQSPKRISSRLPLKRLGRKTSVSSTEINTPTTSATTVNRASAKVFQLQCDSCNMKFSSHQTLFDHKVLKHGLNTPDKKNILERSNKKKTLFKQRGTFSGIPASAKLTSAYAALRSKMDNLG